MVVTIGLMLLLLHATKVEYLPIGNRNLVIGMMLPPPGYNLQQMQDMGAALEQKLKPSGTRTETVVMTRRPTREPGRDDGSADARHRRFLLRRPRPAAVHGPAGQGPEPGGCELVPRDHVGHRPTCPA